MVLIDPVIVSRDSADPKIATTDVRLRIAGL